MKLSGILENIVILCSTELNNWPSWSESISELHSRHWWMTQYCGQLWKAHEGNITWNKDDLVAITVDGEHLLKLYALANFNSACMWMLGREYFDVVAHMQAKLRTKVAQNAGKNPLDFLQLVAFCWVLTEYSILVPSLPVGIDGGEYGYSVDHPLWSQMLYNLWLSDTYRWDLCVVSLALTRVLCHSFLRNWSWYAACITHMQWLLLMELEISKLVTEEQLPFSALLEAARNSCKDHKIWTAASFCCKFLDNNW